MTFTPPEGTTPYGNAGPTAYIWRTYANVPGCPECGDSARPSYDREHAINRPAYTCPSRRHDGFRFAWATER